MKQSRDLDKICIEKIFKYMQTISDAFDVFKIKNADDLACNHICQLAVTQAITNIYELRQRIQEETLSEMPLFSRLKLGLKTARNIASHDYDSLDFGIIYSIATKLSSRQLSSELEVIKNGLESSNASD